MLNLLLATQYGLVTLISLWALGGGQSALFWERLGLAGILILLISISFAFHKSKLKMLFSANASIKNIGLAGGILAGLALLIPALYFQSQSLFNISARGYGDILIFALLFSPAIDLLFRGILQQHWGIFAAAFLEAINWGFGLQNFWPFALFLGMNLIGGLIRAKYSWSTAVVFRCVWTFILFSGLYLSS